MGNTTPDDGQPHTDHLPTYPTAPRAPAPPAPTAREIRARRRTRTLTMLAVVIPVASAALLLTASIGRLDSALLYVGIPCLAALVIGLIDTEEAGGQIFQVVTVILLLFSAFLHEGALCVLIVSPLVYGIAYSAYGVTRILSDDDPRHHASALIAVLPLAALSLEGTVPELRINPEQNVTATDVVASDCTHFEAALARGPEFSDDDRGWLLKAAQYPLPTLAEGSGLDVGDTWSLAMPAGSIETRVTARTASRIDFVVTADDARTTRWVTLDTARLSWQQTDAGCEASVRLDFTRDLHPSFYFGPVTHVFMSAGAEAFLAGLA